jgi:hypothetical protein
VWRAVGVTFKCDSWHADHWSFGKTLLKIVVLCLAFGQSESPAVVVDDDLNVIWVVEGRGAAIERRVIEVPLWRSESPDELVEIVPIFFVAELATFRCEIKLIPPFEFGLRRQRRLIPLS